MANPMRVAAGSRTGTRPSSGMPNPSNHTASLTDQPQLFAALMVVESTWPDLAARAAALRGKMDFSVFYDDRYGCPGYADARHRSLRGPLRRLDRGSLRHGLSCWAYSWPRPRAPLPLCFWTGGLSRSGCALAGPADAPWYNAGGLCANAAIPASDSGGPFLQLAGLLYLASEQIPMGALSLGASAQNMVRAQYQFAADKGLALAGWASASDPDACAYAACDGFTPDKVTAYVSGMAASDQFPETYRMLRAFHLLGADAQLATGDYGMSLGLRDGWNQVNRQRSRQLPLPGYGLDRHLACSMRATASWCGSASGSTPWRKRGTRACKRALRLVRERFSTSSARHQQERSWPWSSRARAQRNRSSFRYNFRSGSKIVLSCRFYATMLRA
jgi:hypothetical protein